MRPSRPFLVGFAVGLAWGAASAGQAAIRPLGSVGCLLENGAVVVPASLDEAAGDWLIDIAAPRTLLHETRAQMEGISTPETIGALRLAGLRIENLVVPIANLDSRAPGFSTPIVGVIGADVLGRYVVDVDFSPCRLTLYEPGRAPGLKGRVLPISVIAGQPTVPAAISDGSRAMAGPFVVDTASKASVRIALPQPHGPDDGDPRQWSPHWIRALSIAGQLFEKPTAARGAELPAGVAGALGTDWLSRYRLRIDIPAGALTLAQQRRP